MKYIYYLKIVLLSFQVFNKSGGKSDLKGLAAKQERQRRMFGGSSTPPQAQQQYASQEPMGGAPMDLDVADTKLDNIEDILTNIDDKHISEL